MKEKHERKWDDKSKCWMIWEPSLGLYVPDDIQTKSGKEEEEVEETPAVKYRTMAALYNKEKEAVNESIDYLYGCEEEQQPVSAKYFLYGVVQKQRRLDRENVTEAWCRSKKLKTLKQIAVMGLMEKWKWSEERCLRVFDDLSISQIPLPEIKASDKTLAERGLNFLTIGENPKVKWILDCICQAIYNKLIRDEKVNVKWSKDELNTAITGDIKEGIFWFSFTDKEFRLWIGRNLKGWQIRELFLEAKKLEVTLGKRKILWDGDKRHWRELLDFSAYLIQASKIEREGTTIERPDVTEDHSSLFKYSFMLGFIFEAMISSNLSWKQYKLLPRRVYQCSLRAQEIYRYFRFFEKQGKRVQTDLRDSPKLEMHGRGQEGLEFHQPGNRVSGGA